jgi:uncharacterized membrane protein (Fun14 family)
VSQVAKRSQVGRARARKEGSDAARTHATAFPRGAAAAAPPLFTCLSPPTPQTPTGATTTTTTPSSPRSADAAAAAIYAWLSHFCVFTLCGIVTVFALRIFGPPVLYFCALVTLILLALAYYGYLNLNWRSVARLSARALDADGDGRLGLGDARVWARRAYDVGISFGGTALAGYMLGLWMGLKMF